jgi:hypothetical protein
VVGEGAGYADYNAGSPDHDEPFYFLEIRIPINRLDLLAKQGLIRGFTSVVFEAEGSDNTPDKCSPRLGDDQRIEGGRLGHRRPHRLAARLYERP